MMKLFKLLEILMMGCIEIGAIITIGSAIIAGPFGIVEKVIIGLFGLLITGVFYLAFQQLREEYREL